MLKILILLFLVGCAQKQLLVCSIEPVGACFLDRIPNGAKIVKIKQINKNTGLYEVTYRD